MPGIVFTVELDDQLAASRLAEMVDRMERPIGFYRAVGEYLVEKAIPRNFSTETAPDGSPWAALSPVTNARREKAGHVPIRILQASQAMAAGINHRPTDDGVRVGTPAKQGAVMQFGAPQGSFGAAIGRTKPSDKRPKSQDYFAHLPWGDIPARPFLGISAADEVEIIRIAGEWLGLE